MAVETVSIIMPAFNAEQFIAQSIGSVLAQRYGDWRLYVVDDASSDNTAAVVKGFDDARIEYLRLIQNGGVATARNAGIERAQGTYIAFLDSDDLWEPEKLEQQICLLEQGYDVVCAHYSVFTDNPANVIATRRYPFDLTYARMLRGNCIGNLTGIYNQRNLGKCQQKRCGHEDYVMWLELIRRAGKGACVQSVLARYRVSSHSISSNKLRAAVWQWEIYRKHLGIGLLPSAYYWLHYIFAAVVRGL